MNKYFYIHLNHYANFVNNQRSVVMKTWIIILFVSAGTMISCASSDKTSKSENQLAVAAEKAKKAEETMKMEEQKSAKEKEEIKAKEELEKKKAESEMQKEELKAVKERLKKMGMAAVYVPVSKDGDAFSYPGGRTTAIRTKVTDDITVRSLSLVVDKQIEKSNSDRDHYNTGLGGFETCLNNQLYILFMSKDKNGMVVREWYETLEKCN